VLQFRKHRGLSLRKLSERSGVSQAMLSEIERGAKNPTVKLAYQVAQALGCSISELLEGPIPSSATTLLNDPPSGVRRESHANSLLHGCLEVVIYTIQPGATSGELHPNRQGTLETVVVLDGQLELRLNGVPQTLQAGESVGHGVNSTEYRNPSKEDECRLLVLVDTTRKGDHSTPGSAP
jgi:transcriptional regulator with XRE-family HTH domain